MRSCLQNEPAAFSTHDPKSNDLFRTRRRAIDACEGWWKTVIRNRRSDGLTSGFDATEGNHADEEASAGDQHARRDNPDPTDALQRLYQRGWRCFLSPLADNPSTIGEDTVPSFHGHSLFDALAMFRATIEPAGGRLLHAMASRESAGPIRRRMTDFAGS